ncbi:MAG: hypothetical protein LBT09_14490 [Planctomycetaceae bacterium]|jgi:tetratricopeptide (TPR) repeat protein|nr:hypothetical protein [Planctomycetaceae bacterium]
MENIMLSIAPIFGMALMIAGLVFMLVVVAIVYIVFTIIFRILVYWFVITRCKKLLKLILRHKQHRLFQKTDKWAEENGFHYIGIFQVPLSFLAGWENPKTSSFLVQYLNFNTPYFEIDTLFDNNICLETGNLRFGTISFPTPSGFYVQHFPQKSLEKLWELHNESIRYLTEQGNAHLTPFRPDLPWGNIPSTNSFSEQKMLAFEVFQNTGFRTMSKFFLWSQRWFYLQFYRPFFWVNKTIQEQVEMGRLVLPQELPSDYEKYFVRWSLKKQLDGFEPSECSKLFSETKLNSNTEEPDTKQLYSREYAVEPETAGRNNKLIGCVVLFLSFVLIVGFLGLFNLVNNYFGNKSLEQVQKLLATQNFDEALKKAVKIRNNSYKNTSLVLVAKEYASAERYDDALKTVSLLPLKTYKFEMEVFERDCPLMFIVRAKVADEQFDDLDIITNQIHSSYSVKESLFPEIAVVQAKAGLLDDAEKTLDKLKDEGSKIQTRLRAANAVFDTGRTGEAIAIVKAIPNTEQLYDDKIMFFCGFALKLAENDNIETTRQLLFDALEINDKFSRPTSPNYLLPKILDVFRRAGKPEEGLRFAQEISLRYSDKKKEYGENENSTWKMTPYSAALCETAILNAELGNYAEGWKILESIPLFFENFNSPRRDERDHLLTDIFHAGRKHGVNMKKEMQHIEKILKPAINITINPETEIGLLERLLNFQVAAQCFDDAVTTAERCEKIEIKKRFFTTEKDFWEIIVKEQADAGKIEDALKTVKKIKSQFLAESVWQNIILAEANANQFDEAIQHLSRCKNKYNREKILVKIIEICIDKGKLTETEKMLELLELPEQKVEATISLAEACFESGANEVADRFVAQTIPLMNQCLQPSWDEPKPEQFLRIAILKAKLGHFSEALIVAERISILAVSKRVTALRAIAAAQTATGKPDDAQATLEKIRWRFAKRLSDSCQ